MAEDNKKRLVRRSQRVAFMDTDTTGSSPSYDRIYNLIYEQKSDRIFEAVCG